MKLFRVTITSQSRRVLEDGFLMNAVDYENCEMRVGRMLDVEFEIVEIREITLPIDIENM